MLVYFKLNSYNETAMVIKTIRIHSHERTIGKRVTPSVGNRHKSLADEWLPPDISDRCISLETKENMHLMQLEALSILSIDNQTPSVIRPDPEGGRVKSRIRTGNVAAFILENSAKKVPTNTLAAWNQYH